MSQPSQSDARFGIRWQDHLGLITTAALTTVTVGNIAAAGNWNTQTSLALLRSMGGISVLTASLISFSPNLLAGITSSLCAYIAYRIASKRDHHSARLRLLAIVVLLLLSTSFLALSILLWAVVLFAILLGLVFGRGDRGASSQASSQSIPLFGVFLLQPFLLLLLQGANWFPSENLAFADPARSTSAYVVNAQEGELTLLTINSKRVVYIRDQQLQGREICSLTTTFWAKTIHQLNSPSVVPPCLPPIS